MTTTQEQQRKTAEKESSTTPAAPQAQTNAARAPVQLKGKSYDEQVNALRPDTHPGFDVQAAMLSPSSTLAPVQAKDGTLQAKGSGQNSAMQPKPVQFERGEGGEARANGEPPKERPASLTVVDPLSERLVYVWLTTGAMKDVEIGTHVAVDYEPPTGPPQTVRGKVNKITYRSRATLRFDSFGTDADGEPLKLNKGALYRSKARIGTKSLMPTTKYGKLQRVKHDEDDEMAPRVRTDADMSGAETIGEPSDYKWTVLAKVPSQGDNGRTRWSYSKTWLELSSVVLDPTTQRPTLIVGKRVSAKASSSGRVTGESYSSPYATHSIEGNLSAFEEFVANVPFETDTHGAAGKLIRSKTRGPKIKE